MKITLMDIMESLNSDNTDDAEAALQEWFLDAAKQVHADLTNPVVESEDSDEEDKEEVEESIVESEDEDDDKEEVTEAEDAEEDDKEEVTEAEETDECEEDEKVEESIDDLIAELAESFKGLETVSDKLQNVEGAQVGEQGKVPVNTKATLPSKKGAARVGGEPVEIKGKGHTGHGLEKAPKVADVKIKNTVQNGKEELKKVADKGDKSALLNKMDGKENTQSPISGKGAKGLKK